MTGAVLLIFICGLTLLLLAAFVLGKRIDFFRRSSRVSAQFQEAERLYSAVEEASSNCVVLLDGAGRLLKVNGSGLRRLGRDGGGLIGSDFAGIWPETSRPAIEKAVREGVSRRLEIPYVRPDGQEQVWEFSLNPIVEAGCGVRAIVGIGMDITERLKAEEELRLAQFSIDRASDFVLWIAPDGRLLYVNGAISRKLGYSREEMLAMGLSGVDPSFPEGPWSAGARALETQGAVTIETRFKRKEGSLFPVEMSLNRLEFHGRHYDFAFARDVSERKAADAALQESERRFRTLADHAPVGIFMTDAAGQCLFVNRLWSDITGIGPAEAGGRKWTAILLAANGEETLRQWDEAAGGRGFTSECRMAKPGGQVVWLSITLSPVLNQAGRVSCHLGTIVDITERRWAEKALRESEEKFRSISSCAHDAIIMMDEGGRISFWNDAAASTFGHTKAEASGKDMLALLAPPRRRDAWRASFEGLRSTAGDGAAGKTVELEASRKDGLEIQVELSLSSVKIEDRWNSIAILRDVTERKRAVKALREAKEAAEAARRDLEITNRSLEVTSQEAKRLAMAAVSASEAKTNFMANMSHEMRTQMNGILGMNRLLIDTKLSAEQAEYAETLRSSAESLLGLINDILDFSKMEAGKLDLEATDFDLSRILEDVEDVLSRRARQNRVKFNCHIESKVPFLLRGDPVRLRQVLIHLANNAIKFNSVEGDVLLWVVLEKETDEEATIRFSVRDNGIGIAPDRLERIFQSSHLEASRTRKHGGTGLGLAISKRLAELMGGRLGVESEEGKGSIFWLEVVFKKQPAGRTEACEPSPNILIVDAVPASRLELEEQVRSLGGVPEGVDGGVAALERLRAAAADGKSFAMVIIDLEMPCMDGAELGRRIREDPVLRDLILVLMAPPERLGQHDLFRNRGFASFLLKPVDGLQLRDCLGLLGKKKAEKAARSSPEKPRILVADDNITNQKVALKLLEKFGFRADAVSNGREACNALELSDYDLVLMDVQMPVLDGFEATGEVRKREKEKGTGTHVPIIAMTAHALKGDRECAEAGMDDYVQKPVEPQVLLEAIQRQLAEKP